MNLSNADKSILYKLVGALDENAVSIIKKNIDFFLHPKVSLFIPSCGQCKYAVTPSHTHPAYSFIYYFQPVSDFIVEDRHISYDLAEGKCLSAVSPAIPHQEIAEENFQSYIAILIDAALFREIMLQYVKTIPVFRGEAFAPHPELLGLLRCFMLEASDNKHKHDELLNYLAPVIVHLVTRSITADTPSSIPLYDRFEVDRTIAYMNSHFSKKITVEDLAKRVNLSAGHFSKVFKSVTDITPIDFLNIIRLQKARNMLINNIESITEIALLCGFNTSSYFSTCFLEKYKMSPSAYRQTFHQRR